MNTLNPELSGANVNTLAPGIDLAFAHMPNRGAAKLSVKLTTISLLCYYDRYPHFRLLYALNFAAPL